MNFFLGPTLRSYIPAGHYFAEMGIEIMLGPGAAKYRSSKGGERYCCRFNLGGAAPEVESLYGVWGCYSTYNSLMFMMRHESNEMLFIIHSRHVFYNVSGGDVI